MINLVTFIHDHWAWSKRTFGEGDRTEGLLRHIERESDEVRQVHTPDAALGQWVDIITLGIDGALRAGHTPLAVAQALVNKQTLNRSRRWPPLINQIPDQPTEHYREGDTSA